MLLVQAWQSLRRLQQAVANLKSRASGVAQLYQRSCLQWNQSVQECRNSQTESLCVSIRCFLGSQVKINAFPQPGHLLSTYQCLVVPLKKTLPFNTKRTFWHTAQFSRFKPTHTKPTTRGSGGHHWWTLCGAPPQARPTGGRVVSLGALGFGSKQEPADRVSLGLILLVSRKQPYKGYPKKEAPNKGLFCFYPPLPLHLFLCSSVVRPFAQGWRQDLLEDR